ncbi:MAG: hypothetical protein GX781_06595 [Clostridiales bacterium]|nr:hypothetical protein [Clostridiales bacterium]
MKNLRLLTKSIKGRFVHKHHGTDQVICKETYCQSIKVAKASIDQNIPSHDHCFNISNFSNL